MHDVSQIVSLTNQLFLFYIIFFALGNINNIDQFRIRIERCHGQRGARRGPTHWPESSTEWTRSRNRDQLNSFSRSREPLPSRCHHQIVVVVVHVDVVVPVITNSKTSAILRERACEMSFVFKFNLGE